MLATPRQAMLTALVLGACSSGGPGPSLDAREASAADASRLEASRVEARLSDQAPSPDRPKGPPHWQTLAGAAPAVRYHTATLLQDGRVLVAGGETVDGAGFAKVTGECWLYDPATGGTATAALAAARRLHTATLLADGRVLVAGGSPGAFKLPLQSAELYDPKTKSWSMAKDLPAPRTTHTAEVLPDARVLLIGGFDGVDSLATFAIYNPVANTWSVPLSKLKKDRSWHTSTLLGQKLLVIGGVSGNTVGTYLDTAEVYELASGTVVELASRLGQPRAQHSTHLLPGGKLLVIGGACADPGMNPCVLTGDERFDPATDSFAPIAHFGPPPLRHAAATLLDGRVVVTGGSGSDATKVVLFSAQDASWTELPSLASGRHNHTATTLGDGSVLVVGGVGTGGGVAVAERLIDP
jgi:N-acetylneuraminic acid mutarotase